MGVGVGGMLLRKRWREPAPEDICPPRDSPLTWVHALGWRWMQRVSWPGSALSNPLLQYLSGRGLKGYFYDFVAALPWLFVLAGELAMLEYSRLETDIRFFLGLAFGELLVLPLLAGFWTQIQVAWHFRRIRGRVPIEELLTTRLRGDEIMAGLVLRPLTLQVALSRLTGLISLGVFSFVYIQILRGSTLFLHFPLLLGALLIGYRAFMISYFVEFSGVLAMRSCLFYRSTLAALSRAMRDWIFPWGILPILFFMVMSAFFGLSVFAPAVFFFLAFLVPLAAVWLAIAIPPVLQNYASDIIYWTTRRTARWSMRLDGDSPDIPRTYWHRWKLEETTRGGQGAVRRQKEVT